MDAARTFMSQNNYIVWNDSLNTGIRAIDEQHRSIVALLNDMFPLLQARVSATKIQPLVNRLKDYTEIHFTDEEQILAECGYPQRQSHLASHRALLNKTHELHRMSVYEPQESIFELFEFVRNWWLNHICKADMDWAHFVKMGKKTAIYQANENAASGAHRGAFPGRGPLRS
jgi:hemerythrin-like metal-binding protein